MLKAEIIKHPLIFKQAGGTSRGVLAEKDSWFIKVYNTDTPSVFGIGECSILKRLSFDDRPDLPKRILCFANNINENKEEDLREFPAINFAIEMALIDLKKHGKRILFPSDFTLSKKSIPINGLIWMGKAEFMRQQIKEKIESGFTCIKLKIGAIDFETELDIIKEVRKEFSVSDIEIRVDANGAFHPDKALEKLDRLSKLELHSIEQPIMAGQIDDMARLCESPPLPIALDEELIGIFAPSEKEDLLEQINPQYIILKPSLLGGFKQSEEWIHYAEQKNIGWWATSALESNIGLNAIAQWVFTLKNNMPQGLGTGQLFTNNIPSPLEINKGTLHYSQNLNWNLKAVGI
jgi:o-succinylbenzoate synthase